MTTFPIFQVDAFTDRLFAGNPAAVCPLTDWLEDDLMQAIASENNLSETAFVVGEGSTRQIRWFTPAQEVDLCGHATLASAHVLFTELGVPPTTVRFDSRSGPLVVSQETGMLAMELTADDYEVAELPDGLVDALGNSPAQCFRGRTDFMIVYPDEASVTGLSPDFQAIKRLPVRGVIATAPGDDVDFVSRFFAPGAGVDEDPVTGSAHTTLTPYWARQLSKNRLSARQLSRRGGLLDCELSGDRVVLRGNAVTYLKGQISVSRRGLLCS